MRVYLAGAFSWFVVTAPLLSVQSTLDRPDVDQAVVTARTGTSAERARFHSEYRLRGTGAPEVDTVDAVTPFRRVVLEAERRVLIGDRAFGQQQALSVAERAAGRIEIWVRLSFHPLNTFVGVPSYEARLVGGAAASMSPTQVARLPRAEPKVGGMTDDYALPNAPVLTSPKQPLLGGTIVASFDLTMLEPSRTYAVLVVEPGTGREIWRGTLDLSKIR